MSSSFLVSLFKRWSQLVAELETNQIIPWLHHVFQLLSLVTRFGLLQASGALIVTMFSAKALIFLGLKRWKVHGISSVFLTLRGIWNQK
jgi:hypothetical protein